MHRKAQPLLTTLALVADPVASAASATSAVAEAMATVAALPVVVTKPKA